MGGEGGDLTREGWRTHASTRELTACDWSVIVFWNSVIIPDWGARDKVHVHQIRTSIIIIEFEFVCVVADYIIVVIIIVHRSM